ncbi:DUF305 domain-containing protein [Mycolicibacterium vanbaalenii]|uniref:DUF305 domain-containing protein n=1 Tax=Mycolicibacterium vanbaalenii TaxID=110539 RepID=UPI001F47A850|nr:DUF305 domain-containing protein [Mycolicibacterium vanbaalenii]UJL28584.1 DUF305 domain-containing protein [Mycolicibacterium vanbaalenii]WND55283.1 DUF305 domain-containing protein [Mycolicibacterium vanbaalenii]
MSSKRGLLMGAGAVGATFALLLSGCSDVGTQSADHDHTTHQHEAEHETMPAGGAHTDADIAFARDMVPHHEQAIVMSDIILAKRDIDPRVTELANQIKAAQGPEIATMQQRLAKWGTGAPSGHEGHGMGGDPSAHAAMGMMTEEQLEQLRRAEGVEAARLFLTGMIAHHEGAVTMAQTEVDTGRDQEAVHLAHEIIETQQREIDAMKQILGSL